LGKVECVAIFLKSGAHVFLLGGAVVSIRIGGRR
jgi:hypothetical protein